MEDKIYIIIVTYNGMEWLQKSLASIPKKYETIIVDNNSSDGTIKYIKENFPNIILFEQSDNLGFGGGNNFGISYALKQGAEFVFLLNQDAYLQPDTIENLVDFYLNNKDYGILSPIHLNGEGNKLDRNFSYYINYDKNDTFIFEAVTNSLKKVYNISFVNAAAWLLPRNTLETVGGFDPIFHHYGEDDNYCQRVLFHDLRIGVITNSFVMHDRISKKPEQPKDETIRLNKKERFWKSKLANINIDLLKSIEITKRDVIKTIIYSIITLQFKKANYSFKEWKLINKIESEIYTSRTINEKKGSHYLNS